MSSQEIHQKFKNDGYYVANNVVENDDIEKILESVSRAYFKHNVNSKFLKNEKPWDNLDFHKEIIEFRENNPNDFSMVYDSCQANIPLTQLISSKKIAGIGSKLLQCKDIDLSVGGNMIRMDTPNDTRNKTAWHQEIAFVRNPGLVLWIPLVEITSDIGPLHILEKSHANGEIIIERNDIQDYKTSRVSKTEIPTEELNKYSEKAIEINKGDALFFDTKLIHKSGDNITRKIRFSCQTRFSDIISEDFAAYRPDMVFNPHSIEKLNRKLYD